MTPSRYCRKQALRIILLAAALWPGLLTPAATQPPPGPVPARPVILEFSRKLCPICREMEQTLLQLQRESHNQFEVRILYIDEDIKLFRQYQVSLVPTQVLDAEGKPVVRHEGMFPRDQLIQKLKEIKFIGN